MPAGSAPPTSRRSRDTAGRSGRRSPRGMLLLVALAAYGSADARGSRRVARATGHSCGSAGHDELEAPGSNRQNCAPPRAMVPPANAGSPPVGGGSLPYCQEELARSQVYMRAGRRRSCGRARQARAARLRVAVTTGRRRPVGAGDSPLAPLPWVFHVTWASEEGEPCAW
jgi:hypothetical protein